MSNSIEPSNDNIQETNGTEIVENTGDNDERSLSSNLYKDFSGIDTESFIMTTLKNNPKDRTLLLSLEKVFQEFIQDEEQTSHQFQAMNSYERMIVHRVAAFFGLDHNVDKNGQSIIVTKTANTRIPNLCFQTIIPTDEITNGANNNSNESNSRRSTTIRTTNKTSNQQIFQLNKASTVDRSNYYLDNREKYLNKFHRKQQRFHAQQPTSQFSNSGNQPMYSSISTPYYPQQSIEHDYKQQTTNSPMHNYVQMIGPNTYQHGTNLPVPILLHQQPTGQIQYVFPAQQQQQQQQLPIPSDGQYMPIYHSDGIAHVMDNNLYSPSPYVQVYPTHPYHPTQQSAPSFLIPSTNPSNAIQYATNQLAALNLQSQYDSDTRFIPSMHSNKSFQSTRHIRPMNFHSTDKQQLTSNENEIKSSDQTIRQEKD